MIPLVWILWHRRQQGRPAAARVAVVDQLPARHHVRAASGGGAVHAIQGTLIQALVTAVIAVPIGVLTAIYLVEYGRGRLARAVSFMVDILTGIPSIVAALFIYAVWVTTFGFQRVGFAVSPGAGAADDPGRSSAPPRRCSSSCPTSCARRRTRSACRSGRRSSRSCCRPRSRGIITGVLLGLARVMGETAPLLILGPYTKIDRHATCSAGYMPTLPTMINQDRSEVAAAGRRPRLGRGAHPDPARPRPQPRRPRRRALRLRSRS